MTHHPLRYVALTVALLAIGAALSAQDRGPGFGPGRGHAGEGRGLKSLNLTEAQQTQVKAIHDKHQATMKAKLDAALSARKALHEAMATAATDAATLKGLHDKASAAQFDLLLEHRAIRQEILPLLTAEQKAQFEKLPMGMGAHGGRGPGFGPRSEGMGPGAPHGQPS